MGGRPGLLAGLRVALDVERLHFFDPETGSLV